MRRREFSSPNTASRAKNRANHSRKTGAVFPRFFQKFLKATLQKNSGMFSDLNEAFVAFLIHANGKWSHLISYVHFSKLIDLRFYRTDTEVYQGIF